jgi:hypothetical protein
MLDVIDGRLCLVLILGYDDRKVPMLQTLQMYELHGALALAGVDQGVIAAL